MNNTINRLFLLMSLILFILSIALKIQKIEMITYKELILLLMLMVIFSIRKPIIWISGVGIFIIGIANLILKGIEAAEPTTFQIGIKVFRCFLYEGGNSLQAFLIFWFPLVFYVLAIVFFLLKSTRVAYNISR